MENLSDDIILDIETSEAYSTADQLETVGRNETESRYGEFNYDWISEEETEDIESYNEEMYGKAEYLKNRIQALREVIPNCNKCNELMMLVEEAIDYIDTLELEKQMQQTNLLPIPVLEFGPDMRMPMFGADYNTTLPLISPFNGAAAATRMNIAGNDAATNMGMPMFGADYNPAQFFISPFHGSAASGGMNITPNDFVTSMGTPILWADYDPQYPVSPFNAIVAVDGMNITSNGFSTDLGTPMLGADYNRVQGLIPPFSGAATSNEFGFPGYAGPIPSHNSLPNLTFPALVEGSTEQAAPRLPDLNFPALVEGSAEQSAPGSDIAGAHAVSQLPNCAFR